MSDEVPKKKAERKPMDPEVQTMGRIAALLDSLDAETALRVASWAKDKAQDRAIVSRIRNQETAITRINHELCSPHHSVPE